MSLINELTRQLANFPTERQINIQSAHNSSNMALPQISVRDYLDLIPPFDGNPTKLSTFIKACEQVFPLMAPDNELARITFTMLHVRTKLIGKAAALTAARNFTTFPELKEILVNLFGDQRNEESLLSELNTLKQRVHETPHQFADRCIDIRCLLLSKLSCQAVPQIIKDTKLEMYNSFTLRAFLTGVNPQLSHLLRCRNPTTIEEATQIVTEEENLNYHRTKIGATIQNQQPTNKPQPKSAFQLRINSPQTRNPNFAPTPIQQIKKFTPPTQQKWIPRTFPVRQPFFQQQNYSQRPQVPGTSQQPKMYQPTPMDVDSDRTRLTRQSNRTNQPVFRSEELTTQEVEAPGYQDCNYTDEPEYYEPEHYKSKSR